MKTHTPRILMVDDEQDQRESFKNYFSKRRLPVFTAASGEEALVLIKKLKPDLVFLDLRLSAGPDGKEVLRILREYDKETRVAVVTGNMLKEKEVQELTSLGIVELLTKPLSFQQLDDFVRKVLAGKYPHFLHAKPVNKTRETSKTSLRRINHELANATSDISSKCELYLLNTEEGIYKKKSEKERLAIAHEIIESVAQSTEKLKGVVERISGLIKREA